MISKIFTVRDSERGMSSHHQPSFCNLKVRKNGLQLGRQRQQSVCERCIRIAGVSYLVIYARCHTQLCRKSRRSSLNSCGDMVGTYTRRRRKSLLYLWRKTKGEKKNDQNSVCLPRQYLSEPHGRVRHEGAGEKGRDRGPVPNCLCSYQCGGGWKPGIPAGTAEPGGTRN